MNEANAKYEGHPRSLANVTIIKSYQKQFMHNTHMYAKFHTHNIVIGGFWMR